MLCRALERRSSPCDGADLVHLAPWPHLRSPPSPFDPGAVSGGGLEGPLLREHARACPSRKSVGALQVQPL
eukprot:12079586-Alexandrium_andersonii.AAC.1